LFSAAEACQRCCQLPPGCSSSHDKILSSPRRSWSWRSMPLDATRMVPTGGAQRSGYDLEIGAVKHCGGANACFVAGFTAVQGGKVFGRHVTVKGASRAGFTPLSCGASCSPPQIDFVWHGVLYTIQANLKTKQTDRVALIAAAASAISAGPR